MSKDTEEIHRTTSQKHAPPLLCIGLDGNLQAPRGIVLRGGVDVHQDRQASVFKREVLMGGCMSCSTCFSGFPRLNPCE